MFYTYIMLSLKSHIYYIDTAAAIEDNVDLHNRGRFVSTRPFAPWKLIWCQSFNTMEEAKNFEKYLKSSHRNKHQYKKYIS